MTHKAATSAGVKRSAEGGVKRGKKASSKPRRPPKNLEVLLRQVLTLAQSGAFSGTLIFAKSHQSNPLIRDRVFKSFIRIYCEEAKRRPVTFAHFRFFQTNILRRSDTPHQSDFCPFSVFFHARELSNFRTSSAQRARFSAARRSSKSTTLLGFAPARALALAKRTQFESHRSRFYPRCSEMGSSSRFKKRKARDHPESAAASDEKPGAGVGGLERVDNFVAVSAADRTRPLLFAIPLDARAHLSRIRPFAVCS